MPAFVWWYQLNVSVQLRAARYVGPHRLMCLTIPDCDE
jgi:hypothetical protein